MSRANIDFIAWLDQRIDEMLSAPRMWGSLEVVEMQLLTLIEARWFARLEQPLSANPRQVFEMYLEHLRAAFPQQCDRPLSQHLASDDYDRLVTVLREFRTAVQSHADPELARPDESRVVLADLFAALKAAHEQRTRDLAPIVKDRPQLERELEKQSEEVDQILERAS